MSRLTTVRLFVFGITFILAMTSLMAHAEQGQVGDTAVSGVITTLDGDLRLEGVAITATDSSTGAVVGSSASNDRGRFEISNLPVATYSVTASLAGFAEMTQIVSTLPGEAVEVNFDLPLAALEEDVDVEGRPGVPLDLLDTPMLVETIDGRLIDVVPIRGENFDALLPLLPGVVRDADGRLSVKGGQATQTSLRVNSVNVSDPVTGEFGTTLPDDAVDTVRLLPNPYAAEYGGFSAGVSEVETRRGTDEWTWSTTNFVPALRYRDSSLQGIEKFRPRLAFSGPLKEGRVFLAQSLQYRLVKTEVPIRPETANDTRLQSFDSFTQIDADLSARHLLRATFSLFPRDIDLVNVDTFNPREVSPNLRQRGFNLAVTERTVLSPRSFLETTFAYKELDIDIFGQGSQPMVLQPQMNAGNFYNQQARKTRTINFREALTLQLRNRTGEHVFKFGVELLDAAFDGESLSRPVEVRRVDGTLSQRITYGGATIQDVRNTDIGLFVQDRWRVNDRLLFELGTRLDRNGIVKSLNLAPRGGTTFSLNGDGTVVLRGGIGLFLPETTLNGEAFESYEAPTVTWFASDGTSIQRVVAYTHRLAATKTPSSLIWNTEYFHQLSDTLYTKVNFLRRSGDHELILHPLESGEAGVMELRSDGRSRYWEVEWTSRLLLGRHDLNFSFVRSRAEGDLNVYDEFFGNFRNPIIRPNQFSVVDTDTRNRFLFRGIVRFGEWTVTPVLEVRQGFPYSIVDENLNFVGARNQGGRFPRVSVLDIGIQRPLSIAGFDTTIGLRMFHLLETDLPLDVQRNINTTTFGRFSNQIERSIGVLFRLDM